MNQKFIIYKRLSTKREIQLHSFEVQERIINKYLESLPNEYTIIKSYEEELSGAKNNRPMLESALADCKFHGATLLTAKLDRLSRDVGKVDYVVKNFDLVIAEHPSAPKSMLQMMAVFAEMERDVICKRISDGVNNAIAKGAKCGNRTNHTNRRTFTKEDAIRGVQTAKKNKATRMMNLKPQVMTLYNEGRTMAEVATMLNGLGVPTTGKGKWYSNTVKRVIDFAIAS